MEIYKVIQLEPAIEDIEKITLYMADELKSNIAAKAFSKSIKKAIGDLMYFPYRYGTVGGSGDEAGIRNMPYKSYNIFYIIKPKEKEVLILRVLKDRQNWKYVFDVEEQVMKVHETEFVYGNKENIKIGNWEFDSRLPQDLIDELMVGVKALEEGRMIDNEEAFRIIDEKLKDLGI